MAFNIKIIKTKEDSNDAYYTYHYTVPGEAYLNDRGRVRYKREELNGKIKINKKTGEYTIIQLAEGDKGLYAQRAVIAVLRYWRNGVIPDEAYYQA